MIIPLWIRAAAVAAILAALAGAGWWVHHTIDKGGYDRANAEHVAAAENLRVMQQEGIDSIGGAHAIQAAKQRVITQTIIKEVDRYVPNTLPMLPAGFRVLHDAAANGQAPVYPIGPDVSPVAPSTVAGTIAQNYADCRYDQGRLEALQAIVRTINGGNDGKTEKE